MIRSFVLCSLTALIAVGALAQSSTAILPFKEGKAISNQDIEFLRMINNEIGRADSRGGAAAQVTIGGVEVKGGSTLTKEQAAAIEKAVEAYGKQNASLITDSKEAPSTRSGQAQAGCGYCCYYYYWDSWCTCYRYYWYFCCMCW